MVLLPLAEIVARQFGAGIPGAQPFVQHLTLWVGFLGAALAARQERLLALATGTFIPEGRWRAAAKIFSNSVAALVSTLLAWASAELVVIERGAAMEIALGVETWMAQLVLPVSFALIALRLVWRAAPGRGGRLWAATGIAVGLGVGLCLGFEPVFQGLYPGLLVDRGAVPGLVLVLLATALGGPIFVALGGAALVLFLNQGISPAAIPIETYRLAVDPTLAAIPLFTLTGFLLAEGKASQRLLRVFRAFFGWIPGGTAVVCTVVCAFFTVFTGGSGVTILALGGVLLPALLAERYREEFSLGLLTASGSLGLLWPPALPLILYGIVAKIPIEDLFLGGLLPGLLLVSLVAAWGVREGLVTGAGRTPFRLQEAATAVWHGKWELVLPILVLVAIFGGFATLVEAAALAASYTLISQCWVHRDISVRRDLLRVFQQCAVLVGGVLVILGVAMGLTSYLVDARAAIRVLELVQEHIHSPLVFLLCLNLLLLVVGCLMDIFSATVVVVPLIVPMGLAFDIHPVHLGIIFVANLELGYLTPPVGLNLFLAAYRFERPLLQIYRSAVPMLIILAIGVLLVTYVPVLTTGVLSLLGRN